MSKITITALDDSYDLASETGRPAVHFVVRDNRSRNRFYPSIEAAEEAAATFDALGFVLEDETVAVEIDEPEHEDDDGMSGLLGCIVSELQQENDAGLAEAYPSDAAEITAIGPLEEYRYIMTGEAGLDVYGDGDDSAPYMTIPRGLAPEVARLLIDNWEAGYQRGLSNGDALARREMRRVLGVSS